MAKSLRSKREKRLRTIRREIVEPYYEKKDAAKFAALEAALAAPKIPVFTKGKNGESFVMDDDANDNDVDSIFKSTSTSMDVDMDDGDLSFLKPSGGVGKKKRGFKVGKNKHNKRKGKKTGSKKNKLKF